MPAPASRHNPFEFGGELKASSLIDREQELDLVIRTIENGGKLFLIGPRRYGKTSILAAAEEKLGDSSVAVLRYDAEVYESLGHLAEALLAGAAKSLPPPSKRPVRLSGDSRPNSNRRWTTISRTRALASPWALPEGLQAKSCRF